jgi:hypothetical protein
MLTIRWIEEKRDEVVIPVKDDVRLCRPENNPGLKSVTVYAEDRDTGATIAIDNGKVYVMNEQAKTVASFDLTFLKNG